MTAHAKSHSCLAHLIGTFGDWLRRRRALNELRALDGAEFERIAGDLLLSPDDLDALVDKGPHATDELEKLLRALGIDEARLARMQPTVLRDMKRVCAFCRHKRECDHDIVSGTSAERYAAYCPNAPSIAALDEPTTP